MKPKRKEFREPETTKGFTYRWGRTSLATDVCAFRIANTYGAISKTIPVRIIRERDYKRLVRAAKGKGK